jgi:HEAT repeat protein
MRPTLALLLLGWLAPASLLAGSMNGLGKGETPPTLYELAAHSDLVVAAKVLSGQIKLAQVEVLEVFRGKANAGDHLQIAFRDFNLDLSKQDRIQFTDGETEILFLIPEVNLEGVPRGDNRYTLYRGRLGRFTLPREGDEIYLDALRVFASLAAEKDYRKLYGNIRGLLGSPNPILSDVGLSEVLRLDLMDSTLLPKVLAYLQDPAPERRGQALQLLGKFFATLKSEDRSQELQDDLLPQVQTLARNDSEESVRGEAVAALGAWGGPEVLGTLEAIADQDPAQSVRYKAKVILLRRAQSGRHSAAAGNGAAEIKSGPP